MMDNSKLKVKSIVKTLGISKLTNGGVSANDFSSLKKRTAISALFPSASGFFPLLSLNM